MAKTKRVAESFGTDATAFAAVRGTPEKKWDPTFDSYLTRSHGQNANVRLKIVLRLNLKPDLPGWEEDSMLRSIEFERNKIRSEREKSRLESDRRIGRRLDANNRGFPIKSWSPAEWMSFVDAFVRQSMAWNRRFWLIPPVYFSQFDLTHQGKVFRPNIECEFELAIVGEGDNPHNTLIAVNLAAFDEAFRPNAWRMSSRDANIRTTKSVDAAGLPRTHDKYSTVAHEVGHMLGQRHIGMIRDSANCELAQILDEHLQPDLIPAIWKGGVNANVCYGDRGSDGDANNVMGMGSEFAEENARPWQNRLVEHMRINFDVWDWKVAMAPTLPQIVPQSK